MFELLGTFLFFLFQASLVHRVNGIDNGGESIENIWWREGRILSSESFPSDVSCLICNVAAGDAQYAKNVTGAVEEFLGCMTESSQEPDGLSDQVYALDQLPKAFVRQYNRQLYSGNSRICIHQGQINRQKHQVVIPSNPTIQFLPGGSRRRRLYPATGQYTALVVLVTSTAGEDPGLTASQLEGTIFATGPYAQTATLTTQYAACSQNKFTLVPATGNNIVNGVLEVQYQGQVSGGAITGALQSAINQLVIQSVGVKTLAEAANHILFCLPNGSQISAGVSSWIAFSYLNGIVSFFQMGWCQRITAQVHEMGHQLGFKHSGQGIYQYNDESCTMGGSYNETGKPQECFNGHKNWLSGWFDDRKVLVDPISSGAWLGNLVTFVDYPLIDQVPSGVAVINAGDLYIQLNSAKKYNYQVVQNGNKVTVVENNATAPWSNILTGLSSGQSYTYANYSGTGIGLVIQICDITFGTIDYAKISLYLEDGVQKSLCSSNSLSIPVSTPAPSSRPSSRPPTKLPTSRPSPLPTKKPTSRPTASAPKPVAPPVHSPTPPPSHVPTSIPTRSPTPLPTTLPTVPPTTMAPSPSLSIDTPTSASPLASVTVPPVTPMPTTTIPTTPMPTTFLPTSTPSTRLPTKPTQSRPRKTPKPRRRSHPV